MQGVQVELLKSRFDIKSAATSGLQHKEATVLDYLPVPAWLRRGQTGNHHQYLPILTNQLKPAALQHC